VCVTVTLIAVISLILVIHCVLSVAANITLAVTSARNVVLDSFRNLGDQPPWTPTMPVNVCIGPLLKTFTKHLRKCFSVLFYM